MGVSPLAPVCFVSVAFCCLVSCLPTYLPLGACLSSSKCLAYHPHIPTATATQVPDGEFLCPKCKTDEAAAPPLTPSKANHTAHPEGSSAAAQSGRGRRQSLQANGPGPAGEYGRPAATTGEASTGASAGGGAGTGDERAIGLGAGLAGISMLATDGSMVNLTQIAM